MAYLKPQTPLKDLNSGDYFYPLTTIDQIITGNNRLSAFMSEDNNLLNLSNIGNLSVSGNTTINGNLTVSGNTTINGNLTVSGAINGNSSSATQLLNTRTIWGQNFNGTQNISGDMIDVGPGLLLPSGRTQFSFLTSTEGAANGYFGRILLSDNYSSGDISNYRLYVNGGNAYISTDLRVNRYVYAAYYNASCGAESPSTGSYWIYSNSDGWFRKATLDNTTSILGNQLLRYNGWWTSDSGQSLENARGMVFAYSTHGHPGTWGTVITFSETYNSAYRLQIAGDGWNNNLWFRNRSSDRNGWYTGWKRVWTVGESITSAVWNDYAENRCAYNDVNFGQVLMEVGDDTLVPTTERLSHFAGIASDTWGFSQGETETAKTPIAVAGRVLAYPYRDRSEYKPGDCLCAAPNGTVDIMTREEVRKYPDRIVGTVSCVPTYEEWGGGKNADREPVKVNGRIWVHVR